MSGTISNTRILFEEFLWVKTFNCSLENGMFVFVFHFNVDWCRWFKATKIDELPPSERNQEPWSEHFSSVKTKGFPAFVIQLKRKIFLTLNLIICEWNVLNFEPFGRGFSRENLCNMYTTTIYYPIIRLRCVSTVGLVPRMFFKEPHNKYPINFICSIRTVRYGAEFFLSTAYALRAWKKLGSVIYGSLMSGLRWG